MWGCRRHPHPASAGRMAKDVGIKPYAWNCKKVIFSNNGADQYPGQNEEGLSVTGEKWYKSGNFYNQNPDMSKITVPVFDTGDCFFFNKLYLLNIGF